MNETLLWNTTEEAFGYLFLGGISISLHIYALFLCSAIFDYQDEKPFQDKSSFDVLVKDLLRSNYWFLFSIGFFQVISLVTPPLKASVWVYMVTYFGIFSRHYFFCSHFVTLYVKYVFIFQPDIVEGLSSYKLWRKTIAWKIFLTFCGVCMSMCIPLEEKPLLFKVLTKRIGEEYDRYFLHPHYALWKILIFFVLKD